ncbi:MAG: DUF1376 domain-containing protein [Gemmatimonadales bacterium]
MTTQRAVAPKAPAYQWYPRDFASDEPVQLMTLEEEGAYRRLLDFQWLNGSIPADVRQLARICKNVPVQRMRRIWGALQPCFMAVEGDPTRLFNRRLERVRAESQEFREAQARKGRLGAEARWGGKATDGPGHAPANSPAIDRPLPEDGPASASASASASATTPVGRPGGAAALLAALPDATDRQAVSDFLARIPAADRTAWAARLEGYLEGLDFPAGVRPTASQLATACRDYSGDFAPVHFRGFVRRAIEGARRGDRRVSGAGRTARTLAAAERFAKGGNDA